MTIPLVAQGTIGSSTNPYFRSSSNLLLSEGQAGLFSPSLRIGKERDADDAAKASLKETTEKTEDIEEADQSRFRVPGYLGSALRHLSRLSNSIEETEERIKESGYDLEQREQLNEKLQSLRSEVERVITSDPFQKAITAANTVKESLQSGAISRRALGGIASILGDDFLNLAASGAYGAISAISNGLNHLSKITSESFLENPALASSIGDVSQNILGKLRSAVAPGKEESQKQTAAEIPFIEAPEFEQTSYGAAGELALSLRTYEGKDLLRAVAGGFISDPEHLTQLMIEPPRKDDEEDDEDRKEKEREERSATRNGLEVEESEE